VVAAAAAAEQRDGAAPNRAGVGNGNKNDNGVCLLAASAVAHQPWRHVLAAKVQRARPLQEWILRRCRPRGRNSSSSSKKKKKKQQQQQQQR
jgi:hypothetical protein